MKPRLFVSIGGVANGDYALIHRLARSGRSSRWSSLKEARPGDWTLIYVMAPHSAFVARAKVLTNAVKGGDGQWPYLTRLGRFKLLPNQLTLRELKREFPRWPWLRYPRGKAVVPESHADRLWKLVHAKPKSDRMSAAAQAGAAFGDAKTNRLVERAAVRIVAWHLRHRGYRVISREKENLGYDLEARKGRSQLHVEVKGISGKDLQFPITRNEVNCAGRDSTFRLMVVTEARTRKARVHEFQGCEFKRAFRLAPLSYLASRA